MRILLEHVGESRMPVGAFERCCAVKHFKDQDPHSPPVDGGGMAAAFDDFRCNVFFRSDKGLCINQPVLHYALSVLTLVRKSATQDFVSIIGIPAEVKCRMSAGWALSDCLLRSKSDNWICPDSCSRISILSQLSLHRKQSKHSLSGLRSRYIKPIR